MPIIAPKHKCNICNVGLTDLYLEYPNEFIGYLCHSCYKSFFLYKQKQLIKDSKNGMIFLLLGRLAKGLNQSELAKEYRTQALKIQPECILNFETWWILDKEAYLQVYKKMPKGSIESITACRNLAYVSRDSILFEDAILWLERILSEGDIEILDNHIIIGVCENISDLCLKFNKYEEGILIFKNYLTKLGEKSNRLKPDVFALLAKLYKANSQLEKSIYCLETAISQVEETFHIDDIKNWCDEIIELYIKQNQGKKAISFFYELILSGWDSYPTYLKYRLGKLNADYSFWNESLKWYMRAISDENEEWRRHNYGQCVADGIKLDACLAIEAISEKSGQRDNVISFLRKAFHKDGPLEKFRNTIQVKELIKRIDNRNIFMKLINLFKISKQD